jgi:hypothetical protein
MVTEFLPEEVEFRFGIVLGDPKHVARAKSIFEDTRIRVALFMQSLKAAKLEEVKLLEAAPEEDKKVHSQNTCDDCVSTECLR